MINTDEYVDAKTEKEDTETRHNMNWLNNRVIELEAEVQRLREVIEKALIPTDTNPIVHPLTKLSDLRNALKELIE